MQFPKINNCQKNFAIKLRGLSSAIYPVHFFLMLHRAPSCSGGAVQAVEEWCQFFTRQVCLIFLPSVASLSEEVGLNLCKV